MDAIITYVNGLDPQWQKEYATHVGGTVLAKRYRDWGTLKYLLRGIEKHLPFIESVYLIVSGESQVPSWVDRSSLHVVLHRDIIPEQFLPTFNSTTIEMFMHRIQGLDEEFLYFNDDMFPVMDCTPDDFFVDGRSATGFTRHILASGKFKKRVRNSDHQARRALGMKPSWYFVRPQHTCSPMLRSESEACYEKSREAIFKVVSSLRTEENFNQYLYLDYLYYKGKTVLRRLSNKHLSPAVHSAKTICSYIDEPSCKLICINDVEMDENNFLKYSEMVRASFERHFPKKSRFELNAAEEGAKEKYSKNNS
jgi:hypothetical protein